MPKIKLTKGELKRQRDSLAQFQHYLPTLLLKKQQLQMKVGEARKALYHHQDELARMDKQVRHWVGLLADPWLPEEIDLKAYILPEEVQVEISNIAGANVPVFQGLRFKDQDYDLYATPYWLDAGLEAVRNLVTHVIEIELLEQQIRILQQELRVTTQRVNLFEKVKIPTCLLNIRKIRIYLGDMQANAVGISKVAKKKIGSASGQAGLAAGRRD